MAKKPIKKKVVVPKKFYEDLVIVCPECKGTGRNLPEKTCPSCNGTGK